MTPIDALKACLREGSTPELKEMALAGLPDWFRIFFPVTVRIGEGCPIWFCPYDDPARESDWCLALSCLRGCTVLWPGEVRVALLAYRGELWIDTPRGLEWREYGQRDWDGFATLLVSLGPPTFELFDA